MKDLLVGFAIGALILTETGREVGNKVGNMAITKIKEAVENAKSAEQSTGTAGNNSYSS